MTIDLLQTKLYIPPTRTSLVTRSRLLQRLDQELPRRLTLISAPAGFGKTTLITNWLQNRPTAWLSLDSDDNDPSRFLTYVAATLQRHDTRLGATALSLLHAQPQINLTQITTMLLNELAAWSRPLCLVLDDYHLIDNPAIHEQVTFLLDHLPPIVHLVILSRSDPPFSIARWRVQGQVMELRAADLRFTLAETAVFLNDLMQLNLTTTDIAALEARTEGWVASLQLAALSLRQQSAANRAQFVQHFAGSNRYLMDYLVDEILQQQPADRKHFLLHTAVLNRLYAPLCAAVLADGAPDHAARATRQSQSMLDELESANLFLIPLNEEHTWFRYHHLFADFLQHRLHQSEPEILPQLHDRASRWFAEHEYLDEAIYHALQIPDYAQATTLLADHIETMVVQGHIRQALHRINQLPADLRDSEQRLCLYHAWALLFVGQFEACKQTLERLPTLPNPLGWPVAAYKAVFKGYLTNLDSHVADGLHPAILLLEQALAQLAQFSNPDTTTLIMQGATAVELAFRYTYENAISKAVILAQEAVRLNLKAGNTHAGLAATGMLAQLTCAQGHWRQAAGILEQGLTQAQVQADALPWPGTRLPAAAPLILNLGLIHYQWNDLATAAPLIEEADELYALAGANNQAEGLLGLVQLRWAQADEAAVAEIVKTMQQLAQQSTFAHVRQRLDAAVVEWQIRLVQRGDAWAYLRPEIQTWVHNCGLQGDDPLNFRSEPQYVTLVRAWFLTDQAAAALGLLQRLQAFAAETNRLGDVWRYQLVEVVVRLRLGETHVARDLLQAIMVQTEPEGLIRLYIDEDGVDAGGVDAGGVDAGGPIATLLQQLPHTPYRDRLLAAFNHPASQSVLPQSPVFQPQVPDPQSTLIEPLSARELEVLELLTTGATNQQIADTLIVSHATAKKHVSNIIGKLGVQNRVTAVARARELGLTA